jgi:hypothetical protein
MISRSRVLRDLADSALLDTKEKLVLLRYFVVDRLLLSLHQQPALATAAPIPMAPGCFLLVVGVPYRTNTSLSVDYHRRLDSAVVLANHVRRRKIRLPSV